MNQSYLVISLTALLLTDTLSQDSPFDLDARKRSIPIIEERIRDREAEIEEISNDILEVHDRIDTRLARMVERMIAIKDSAKSGYRVSRAKLELIERLQEMVSVFRSQREALSRSLIAGNSGISAQKGKAEIRHFDEHLETHIEQMLKLSLSFSQDENVEKYRRLGGGGYYGSVSGWYGDVLEIGEEWRQNRRNRTMNRKQRDEVSKALEDSVGRCELRIRDLREALRKNGLSETSRDIIHSELRAHDAMLQKRKREIDELLIVENPGTNEVTRDAADDLGDSLNDLLDDVQWDIQMITLKHAQLNREQRNLTKLKDNFTARKEWLKKHDETQK